jgi:hypothetical protein
MPAGLRCLGHAAVKLYQGALQVPTRIAAEPVEYGDATDDKPLLTASLRPWNYAVRVCCKGRPAHTSAAGKQRRGIFGGR